MAPRERLILLAPGAGAPSSSAWMRKLAERLRAFAKVESFDYPYQREGRRSPDRHAALVAAHRAELERVRQGFAGPVVLAGKSMGGRIGCHLAAELDTEQKPNALVCLGYPLVGQNGAVRDAVLRELQTPVLFVQGTRDKLCPLDRLEAVRQEMTAENELVRIEDGDHSLLVSKRALAERGETQAQVDERIASAIADFLARHA